MAGVDLHSLLPNTLKQGESAIMKKAFAIVAVLLTVAASTFAEDTDVASATGSLNTKPLAGALPNKLVLTYDPAWLGASSCTLKLNGLALASGSRAGTFTWTPSADGIYSFSLEGGGKTLQTTCIVGSGNDVVSARGTLDAYVGLAVADQSRKTLKYDPAWLGASSCTLKLNGRTLASGSSAGTVAWTPTTDGIYSFSLEGGGKILQSTCIVGSGNEVGVAKGMLESFTGMVQTDQTDKSLAYDPSWLGGSSCSIKVNGTVVVNDASSAGKLSWKPEGDGIYSFEIVGGGKSLVNTMIVGTGVGEGEGIGAVDTNEDFHFVGIGENKKIAYSPNWDGSTVCAVRENEKEVVRSATEGVFDWSAAESGRYQMEHETESGVLKSVLTVLGEEVVLHKGTVGADEVWSKDRVHLIASSVVSVPANVSLTIEPGAVVKFATGSTLAIDHDATCVAEGAIFTHIADDTAGGDTLYDGDETKPECGMYTITGPIYDDDTTEYRYSPPVVTSGTITQDTIWRSRNVYHVTGNLTIASGVTLTIMPGAIIKFANGCSLTVNGTLDAQGTRAAPIVFTSAKDDEWGGDTNGDGNQTYAQAGDWHQITGSGTVKMDYCQVLWCSAQNNQGALYPNGGTWSFDNSIVAHCQYDCMRSYGGTFNANNSVFMDSSMGAAPSSGACRFVNCVFYYLTTAVRWGCGSYYNCIFANIAEDIIDTKFYSSTVNSPFVHCCFWAPDATGDKAVAKVGKGGNIWADPKFLDPDNGDFRIADDSPCVDAGDGTVAPDRDYYGRPRMDAKGKTATGVPNADGICPDIGIYEVQGAGVTPVADLAVLSVNGPATAVPGEEISVTYVVTNRGVSFASSVRDCVYFVADDVRLGGEQVWACELVRAYSILSNASQTVTATVRVPAVKEGKWRLSVTVNAEKDVYENVTYNNTCSSGSITIKVFNAVAGDRVPVTVPANGATVVSISSLQENQGAVLAELPPGVVAYAGVGYVPDGSHNDGMGRLLTSGKTALVMPPHASEDIVYVSFVNGGSEDVHVVADILASSNGLEFEKKSDVEVVAKGAKVEHSLIEPASIRDGRVYAYYIEYSNVGDEDADLPIFVVSVQSGGARLSLTPNGTFSSGELNLVGLSDTSPRGCLKSGERNRVPFYVLSNGDVRLRVEVVGDKSTNNLHGYKSLGDYRRALSQAATRLCSRGIDRPDFQDIVVEALKRLRNVKNAAVSGMLRHAVTRRGLAGYTVQLRNAETDDVVDSMTTDDHGYFTLQTDGTGRFALRVLNVEGEVSREPIDLAGEDVNGCTILAYPYSSVSGNVSLDTYGDVEGAFIVLDNRATGQEEDFKSSVGADGHYRITGVPNGVYDIYAYPHGGYAEIVQRNVTISNGVDVVWNPVYMERGGRIRGRVTGLKDSIPATNVCAVVQSGTVKYALMLDQEGKFDFGGLSAGDWVVGIDSDAYVAKSKKRVAVAGGQIVDVTVEVQETPAFLATSPIVQTGVAAEFRMDVPGEVVEWNFGDGCVSGGGRVQTHVYAAPGSYDVSVKYVDTNGVNRVSTSANALNVVEKRENVLSAKGVLLPSTGISVVEFDATHLVLKGDTAKSYPVGTVFGCKDGPLGGFVLKTVGNPVNIRNDEWRFEVERAGLGELFDEFYDNSTITVSEGQIAEAAKKYVLQALKLANSEQSANISLMGVTVTPVPGVDLGASGSLKYRSGVVGNVTHYCHDGVDKSVQTIQESYSLVLGLSCETDVISTPEIVFPVIPGQPLLGPFPLGYGFNVSVELRIEASVKASARGRIEGEYAITAERTYRVVTEGRDADVQNLNCTKPTGSFKFTRVSATAACEVDVSAILGAYVFWGVDTAQVGVNVGKTGGGIKYGLEMGIERGVSADAATIKKAGNNWSALKAGLTDEMRLYANLYSTLTGSFQLLGVRLSCLFNKKLPLTVLRKSLDAPFRFENTSEARVGDADFSVKRDARTVSFAAKTAKVEANGLFFSKFDGVETQVSEWHWDFGDGSKGDGENVSHTYSEDGRYTVKVEAIVRLPNGLIGSDMEFCEVRRTVSREVTVNGEDDDDEQFDAPYPRDGTNHNKIPAKSCDPNEMDGPLGVGNPETERFVKPGEWMDYTIYFENKADAEVPAQEVFVDVQLSEYLDWSTFEMGEVAFNNQNEIVLAGLKNGQKIVAQNGVDYKVQLTVEFDEKTGTAHWYLRSYDPNRSEYNYWPASDGAGFLPPNDEDHRGEGHITYRVKVREDAPAGALINASATIVFDYNDPIETDPAWWNTVAQEKVVKVTIGGVETTLELIVGLPYGELPDPGAVPAGHSFGGWFTGPNGTGRKITADSIVQAGDGGLFQQWLPNTYKLNFNANGGTVSPLNKNVTFGTALGTLPTPPRNGYSFSAWKIGGAVVTTTTVFNWTADQTAIARWTMNPPPVDPTPIPPSEPTAAEISDPANANYDPTSAMFVPPELYQHKAQDAFVGNVQYLGWVRDANGALKGTLLIKAAKEKKKDHTSKLSVSYTPLGGKKTTIKSLQPVNPVVGGNPVVVIPEVGTVTLGDDSFASAGNLVQVGQDFTKSKDKAVKARATSRLAGKVGNYTFALGLNGKYVGFTVAVDKKGKGKLVGVLPDGTKVSISSQGVLGDRALAIPFVYSKKGSFGLVFWVYDNGTLGVSDLTEFKNASGQSQTLTWHGVSRTHELAAGSGRQIVCAVDDGTVQTFSVANNKWTFPKKDANPCGWKMSYKAKDGSAKGQFTVLDANGKKVKYTVNGAVVDHTFYGTAYNKKTGSYPVTAE